MNNFVELEEFPGYFINREGVVIGPKGHPLSQRFLISRLTKILQQTYLGVRKNVHRLERKLVASSEVKWLAPRERVKI